MPSEDYERKKAEADQVRGGVDIRKLDSGLDDLARETGRRMAARKLKELGDQPVELDKVVEAPFRDKRGRAMHYDPSIPRGMVIPSTAAAWDISRAVSRIDQDGNEEWLCSDLQREEIEAKRAERKVSLFLQAQVNVLAEKMALVQSTENPVIRASALEQIAEIEAELDASGEEWRDIVPGRASFARTYGCPGKPIIATSFDPLGRKIECRTPAQARAEAERHGLEIAYGAGE